MDAREVYGYSIEAAGKEDGVIPCRQRAHETNKPPPSMDWQYVLNICILPVIAATALEDLIYTFPL
jgi:hypothetical protein